MITELVAALKAIPHIVDALNRLTDATTAAAASARREEKDKAIDDLIAATRSKREQRLLESEADGVSGGDPSGSTGVQRGSSD